MDKQEYRKRKSIAISIILFLVAILAGFLLLVIFSRKETITKMDKEKVNVKTLYCQSTITPNAFFKSENAETEKHEMKIILQNNLFDQASYTYTGYFDSEGIAESNNAALHAKYNMYLGSIGIDHEYLSPTYSTIKNETIINLYVPRSGLNSGLAPVLFLDPDEFNYLDSYSIKDFQKIYSQKGFTCTINE